MKKRSMRIVVSNQEEIFTGRIAQLYELSPGRLSASWTKVDRRGGTVVTGELLTLRLKALEDSWTTLEGTGGPWRPLKALDQQKVYTHWLTRQQKCYSRVALNDLLKKVTEKRWHHHPGEGGKGGGPTTVNPLYTSPLWVSQWVTRW